MKRYAAFAGADHYPRGGVKDCVMSSDVLTDLLEQLPAAIQRPDWASFLSIGNDDGQNTNSHMIGWLQIVDLHLDRVVEVNVTGDIDHLTTEHLRLFRILVFPNFKPLEKPVLIQLKPVGED